MKKAVDLYRTTLHQGSSTKALDARLLSQLCFRLEQAQAAGDQFALIQALGDMRHTWLTYQVLLSDTEHPYPARLRQDLLAVADTVLTQLQLDSQDVDITLVLSVNRALLAGLDA